MMIAQQKLTLYEFSTRVYPTLKPGLEESTYSEYRYVAGRFARSVSERLIDLTEESLRSYLAMRSAEGKSAALVNKDRRHLLSLWQTASDFGFRDQPPNRKLVRQYPEPKRLPTAWTLAEFERILQASASVSDYHGWTSGHWTALLLTIYDTSHRIGCLLEAKRVQYSNGFLTMEAEQTKQNRAIAHRLHEQTTNAIESLPSHLMLFPWPTQRIRLWRQYKKILQAAGLPATKRDLFHRIRRTSYTSVMSELGVAAATEFAGHSCDLSRIYADPRLIKKTDAIDVLPRPVIDEL